jgi:hypothetical protein
VAQIKINALSFGLLVKDLLIGEHTLEQLAERTGLHYCTILSYTRGLYKAKAIHICGWRMNKNRQYVLKVYKIGDKQDMPKPRKARTHAQRSAKYREKLRLRREKEIENARPSQPAAL